MWGPLALGPAGSDPMSAAPTSADPVPCATSPLFLSSSVLRAVQITGGCLHFHISARVRTRVLAMPI